MGRGGSKEVLVLCCVVVPSATENELQWKKKKKKKKNWSQLHDSPNLLAVPRGELGDGGGREICTAHIHQMANMAHVNPAAHQRPNKPAGSTAQNFWG